MFQRRKRAKIRKHPTVKMRSVAALKKKAWDTFSQFIRLRDCLETAGRTDMGQCITCQRMFPFRLLDAGHFVSGRGNAIIFIEHNCHAQCRHCNRIRSGEVLVYRRRMVAKYGEEEVRRLEDLQFATRTYYAYELGELLRHYKERCEDLKRKG